MSARLASERRGTWRARRTRRTRRTRRARRARRTRQAPGTACPAGSSPHHRAASPAPKSGPWSPRLRELVDRLEPAPAVLFNRLGDVLAYSSGYERIVRPIGLLDDELTVVAGASFADRMAVVPRLPRQGGVECLTHPEAGAVRLSYAGGRRLLVHLPADEASSAALDRPNGRRPGGLAASAR